jgi:hypothetical protein
VVELRRDFPLITDNAEARRCVRTIRRVEAPASGQAKAGASAEAARWLTTKGWQGKVGKHAGKERAGNRPKSPLRLKRYTSRNSLGA